MKYLKEIGIRSKVAFKKLSKVKESKITSVLKNYNRLLKIDKNLIIKENIKDVKKAKRKNLIDRLIINTNDWVYGDSTGVLVSKVELAIGVEPTTA